MNIRNFCLAWASAGLLAALPYPLAAQLPTGRSGFSTQQSLGAHEYWDAVRYFGRCFASVSRAAAFDLLATEPGSREENAMANRILGPESNCIPGLTLMTFTVPHMRGAIAEGLVSLNAPIPPRLALAAPAEGATIHNISEAARCYAAAHPTEVRTLLGSTRPGSDEETTQLEHMSADFFRCVPSNARTYRFGATDVRYRLAEALLRLQTPAPADAASH